MQTNQRPNGFMVQVKGGRFFALVGAPKAATSTVAKYISQHPEILLSEPKEPGFFASDEFAKGWDYYWNKYFTAWNGEVVSGEASTQNLYIPFAAERIHKYVPEARIIAILREPKSRAYSNWWMYVASGEEDLSFEEAVDHELKGLKRGGLGSGHEGREAWEAHVRRLNSGRKARRGAARTYIQRGHYASQLKRYFDLFGRDQILVLFFEDVVRNPFNAVQRIWSFLDVRCDAEIEDKEPEHISYRDWRVARASSIAKRLGMAKVIPERVYVALLKSVRRRLVKIGPRQSMGEEVKERLRLHYCGFNQELARFLNVDLSAWER